MIITLLLLSCAGAEWVEISQQHYRKPLRTNFNFPVTEKVIELPQTKTQTIYTNETLQEQIWSKGNINNVPKLGYVQRVQLGTNPVKAPSLRGNSMASVSAPFVHKNRETSIVPMKAKQEDYNLNSSLELNMQTSIDPVRKVEQYNALKENTSGKIFEETETDNKLKTDKFREQNKSTTNENVSNGPNSSKVETKTVNKTKGMKFNTNPPTTSATDVSTDAKRASNQDNGHLKKISNERINRNNIKAIKGVLIKPNSEKDDFEATVENENISEDTDSDLPAPTNSFKDNEEENDQNENIDQDNSATSDSNKTNAIKNLIKFVKVVADTIRINTRRSVNSKTRYLENLKESILANIEDQIDAAWPDDDPAPRHRRAAQASSRGHVQIPSSESALMTISFLTFAVFLIKLVLQVIQTYKNKAMMVAPTVVATVGRAARKRAKSKSYN